MSRISLDDEFQNSIQSVLEGGVLFIAGKFLYNALTLALNFILATSLGPVLYGLFAYAETIVAIFTIVSRLGSADAILRFIPEYTRDPNKQNQITTIALFTSGIFGVSISFGLYFIAPIVSKLTLESTLFISVLRVLAIVILFNTITNLIATTFRAVERMRITVGINHFATPGMRLLGVTLALLVGFSIVQVVFAIVLSTAIVTVISGVILVRYSDFEISLPRDSNLVFDYYNFALPVMLKSFGSIITRRVDILMVGWLLTGQIVGIYRISILISGMIALPLLAFNQLLPPIVSRLNAEGKTETLESLYQTITRWGVTISLPIVLVGAIYSEELLSIFGESYSIGSTILILFVIAQFANVAVGAAGYMLLMTDHQYVNLANEMLLGLINIGLNYILISQFGIVGAAVATVAVLVGINVIRILELSYLEDIVPYNIQILKPLTAGVLAALPMVGLRWVVSGNILLTIGSLVGGITFLGALFIFGIEDTDRGVIFELIRNMMAVAGYE